MTVYVSEILRLAGVSVSAYASRNSSGIVIGTSTGVMLSQANQLLGTFADLKRFQRSAGGKAYIGWQAHHIVEKQDLDRLGVGDRFPRGDDQLCVLLPERAHIGRINSILRNQAPIGVHVAPADLKAAYSTAYCLIDDYSGGGAMAIRRELMAIVNSTFKRAGF